ncbi:hypothetical protein KIH74_33140 [Kineosporia sp. J2-2]|uniref:HAD family hydrolase n=1 Tax=Kineosporia corallincola TaxID=2835133 RepID=A0ABS5TSP9_9ACTN|nr:hypothetical protein [Kineosporia corallincola]MBT0773838.1 hypothetical protein [Kineosporia corallincola]
MTAHPTVLAVDIDGVVVHPLERFGGRPWNAHLADDLGIAPDALAELFFRPYWPQVITGGRLIQSYPSVPHLDSPDAQ